MNLLIQSSYQANDQVYFRYYDKFNKLTYLEFVPYNSIHLEELTTLTII